MKRSPQVRASQHPPIAGHALARAKERYGLDLDLSGLKAIEARIAAGQGLMLRRGEGDTKVHAIQVEGQMVLVLVGTGDGRIVTFLPEEAAYSRRKRWRERQGEGC